MNYECKAVGEEQQPELYNAAVECVRSATSLEDLIKGWACIDEKNEVVLCNGMDDDDINLHTSLAVLLRSQHKDLLDFYIPLKDVEELYPNSKPFTDFIELSEKERAALAEPGAYLADAINDKRLNKYLGFDPDRFYNDTLNSPLLTIEQAVRMGLCFALAVIGEARFSLLDSMLRSDLELGDTEFAEVPVLSANFSFGFRDPINGVSPGLMNYVYVTIQ